MNKKFNRTDMIQLLNENHKIYRRNKKAFRYMKRKESAADLSGIIVCGLIGLILAGIFYLGI